MLERQLHLAQDFIENALRHLQHQSREAGSCTACFQATPLAAEKWMLRARSAPLRWIFYTPAVLLPPSSARLRLDVRVRRTELLVCEAVKDEFLARPTM